MNAPDLAEAAFQAAVTAGLAVAVPIAAVLFFCRFRLLRPPVGTFNGRDIAVILGIVVALPFLYLTLPGAALPTVLALCFAGGLSIGYQPVVPRPGIRRLIVLILLGLDLLARTSAAPGACYWAINSCVVILTVVAAANLNVQGGMRLRHTAYLALGLACYDAFFATVVPLTERLAAATQGHAFAPSAGMVTGRFGAIIGMGDLLTYALFTTAAYKAYGSRGLRAALPLVLVFGALVPAMAPFALRHLTGHAPSLVPAQMFFGPAAFLGHRLLRRLGPERRMADHIHPRTTAHTARRRHAQQAHPTHIVAPVDGLRAPGNAR